VTLEQAIAPRAMPPPPLVRLVAGMCARTVKNMMQDLQSELGRRHAADDGGGVGEGGKSSSGGKTISRSAASTASLTVHSLWPITAIDINL
jgi:hypothetical protein